MPPRDLMDPDIGIALSSFNNSSPGIVMPYSASSAFFILGISVSGDSRIPFEDAVSGKTCLIYGANRFNRSDASFTSAAVKLVLGRPVAAGSFNGFNQRTSFRSTISSMSGSFSIQLLSSSFFIMF